MRQQVSRYLEIGRLIRRDREIPGVEKLRGRIADAIGNELTLPEEEQKVVGSALMTPTTGVAIAATVAALALIGLSRIGGPNDPQLQRAVAIDDGPVAYTEPDVNRALAEQPSEMLLQYHMRHGESSPGLGPNGIRTRVISLDSRQLIQVEPDPDLVPPEQAETAEEENPVEMP